MHPNNPVRIAIKYLTFIAPVVVVFLSAYFLFHNIDTAIKTTIIIVVIGVILLAGYVSRSKSYAAEINHKQKKAERKAFDLINKLTEKK
jgi:F0F1-type ATP synthase assembly protein I